MLKTTFLLFLLLAWLSINVSSVFAQNYEVTISTLTGEKDDSVERVQYKVGEKVQVKVSIANITETKMYAQKGDDWYRPQLYRNGQLIAYRKEITDRIEKQDNDSIFRAAGIMSLEPHKPQVETIDISYWYPRLKPGQYQFSLERLFDKWERVASNVVFFEVVRNQQ